MRTDLQVLLKKYKYDTDFIYEGLLIDIATNLKNLMLSNNITTKQLAILMEVKPSFVTDMFNGLNITIKNIAKVLSALRIDATIFIKDTESLSIKCFKEG